MSEDYDAKVARYDVEIREIKRRLDNVESSHKAIQDIALSSERLATLVDLTQKQLEKNTKVMQEMHTNLVGLNHEMKEIRDDMDNVHSRVAAVEKERVKRLDEQRKNRNKVILTVVGAVLSAIALAWFGL